MLSNLFDIALERADAMANLAAIQIEADKLDDMVKAIGDFWLTHNALPREACNEHATAYSLPASPAINGVPGTIGTHRDEWHPVVSKQTYGKSHLLDL